MKTGYFLGIDVGTGSARAGLFTGNGRKVASASLPIKMWKPAPDFVEQSSDDIWQACGKVTREVVKQAAIDPAEIAGIGFDATCSLVLLDANDRPVSVSPAGRRDQNIIVWMDHRAGAQAARINRTRHPVLRYVGGLISPEMQTPKLLWLKEHMPKAWAKTERFFDLPDFLTYRATGDDTRSLCTTVCKWTYLGQRSIGWDRSFFKKIGLDDLEAEDFRRIGRHVRPMGESLGAGLTEKAAAELGLCAGTPVGVSIIDAHAGGLGLLGAQQDGKEVSASMLKKRMALIGGTSSCHLAVSSEPRFIRGVWGPYFSAMIPGLWLMEGGQSATGSLIDHVIFSHPASKELTQSARRQNRTVYDLLNERLNDLAKQDVVDHEAFLTRDLHIQPDFHGNRSPRANPTLKGVIVGLTLLSSVDDLARLYLATIQAIAYGTRHILEEAKKKGFEISEIYVSGGGIKNPVFLREHADITGCSLVLPAEPEAVLLGASILGAVASGQYPSILAAMNAMNRSGATIHPSGGTVAEYHEQKYTIFRRMHHDFVAYRRLMALR